jgi:2'-5' RNA ligase
MKNLIVISLPPEPMLQEFDALSQELSELTGAQEALTYPPHVTLRTGFLVPEEDLSVWKDSFTHHLSSISPAKIQLKGLINHQYTDRETGEERFFCGLDVSLTTELQSFHEQLLSYAPYRKRQQTSYQPHLSLAYKDLSREGSEKITQWLRDRPEVEKKERSWLADTISVYHQVDGLWVPWEEFSLTKPMQDNLSRGDKRFTLER